jgi:redox-sensitive bicupin YhaK (pirin superfamily)
VALPKSQERTQPGFSHHPRATIPLITLPGVDLHLIAGTAYGRTAPAPTHSPMFYLAVEMEAGASFELPHEYEERAVYAVSGEVVVDDSALPPRHMAVVTTSRSVRVVASTPARLMLLGGDALDGDRDIWWNFVASSSALIDEASERWRTRGFPPVPGETEFIPLPPPREPRVTFVP